MKMRRASISDLPQILRWRQERADWLRSRGSDQWNDAGLTRRGFARRVADSIAAGETWIAEGDNGAPLGTIAIDSTTDPGLWTQDELSDAYVIHRMIVGRSSAGKGVGDVMLGHAAELARATGRRRLVLDAWTSNNKLHFYYKAKGFRHVRTVEYHSTPSAALFERSVS